MQEGDMLTTVEKTLKGRGVLTSSTRLRGKRIREGFLRIQLGQSVGWTAATVLLCLVLLGLTSGCATQQQFLNQIEPTTLSAAQSRAQFELNCPSVTASILSSKIMQPVWVGGIQRAEYTIGVEGCGRRSVYMAVCPDASNCNAFAQTGRILDGLN